MTCKPLLIVCLVKIILSWSVQFYLVNQRQRQMYELNINYIVKIIFSKTFKCFVFEVGRYNLLFLFLTQALDVFSPLFPVFLCYLLQFAKYFLIEVEVLRFCCRYSIFLTLDSILIVMRCCWYWVVFTLCSTCSFLTLFFRFFEIVG